MKRIRITIAENDIELFEEERQKLELTQADFINFLIKEHIKNAPKTIKYKEIIAYLSDINTLLNEILISKDFDTTTKILMNEKIQELLNVIKTDLKENG